MDLRDLIIAHLGVGFIVALAAALGYWDFVVSSVERQRGRRRGRDGGAGCDVVGGGAALGGPAGDSPMGS